MNVAPVIQKMSSPAFPQFVFEWHAGVQKVYRVDVPGRFVDGMFVPDLAQTHTNAVAIAEHCETHGRFYGCVQTWLRGYRKGQSDEDIGTR